MPTPTRTLPAPTPSVETTTIDITTTVPVEPTTRPPLTITVQPPTTATPTTTTTTPAPVPPPTTTVGTEPTSSSETPWGWIALVLALTGGAILGIILWSRSRGRRRVAAQSARIDELERRTLVALDDVLARGSLVTGQVQALAAEARSLERSSPDDRVRRLRAGLDELAGPLEADRTLRLGSPPPSAEQLNYSTALIRQQVEQLQGVLRAAPPG